MRTLVTGGAGFIGSTLAKRLLAEGCDVTIVDDLSRGKRANLPKGAKFVKMSVVDKRLAEVFAAARPEVVFHLAAQINVRESVKDPAEDARVNVVGALNVLRASVDSGVRKIVFSSSGGAMYNEPPRFPAREQDAECPLSPYGVAKRSFELYLESFRQTAGLNYVALRYANVYGPHQDTAGEAGVVAIFLEKMAADEPFKIFGDGRQTRDFVFVDDVVEANWRAATSDISGVAINIGTAVETSVNELARLVAKEFGKKPRVDRRPAVPGEVRRSSLDPRRARKLLGWRPQVDMKEGVHRTAEWFRKVKK